MRQAEALDLLKLGNNVFLTGAAGAGKTYLLGKYIRYLRAHNVKTAVTASTGIAATHLGGQTIHSWCGIGIKDQLTEDDLEKISGNYGVKRNFKNTRVLIIDEISMLHARQLDMVEEVARLILRTNEPFGGLQVVLCGDFFQLPPVARAGAEPAFAYAGAAWKRGRFEVCYLHEQHRQGDDPLLRVLSDIRSGQAGEHTKVPLRTRYRKQPQAAAGMDVRPTLLYSRNVNVDGMNQRELDKLPGEARLYRMTSSGFAKGVALLRQSCLAPAELALKADAQVLFVKNSQDGRYVNGTRGVVSGFDSVTGLPIVKTFDGYAVTAEPQEWQLEQDGKVAASISQVPLRLAWAITIHKSQGLTLDTAEIDLSDAFEPGMGYAALSRVRSLAGLKLMGLNQIALQVHPEVLELDRTLQALSEAACARLQELTGEQKHERQQLILGSRLAVWVQSGARKERGRKKRGPKPVKPAPEKKISAQEQVSRLLQQKKTVPEIAAVRGIKPATVISYMEKLKGQGRLPCLNHLRAGLPERDFALIMAELSGSADGRLTPIHAKFEGRYDFDTLRILRLFCP